MNRNHYARSAIVMGALLAFTTAIAFAGAKTTTGRRISDQTFAKKADQGDLAEVKLAQLAQTKSQDPTVRNFAQRMLQDHSQSNDKLKNVASQNNVNLPAQPDAKQQNTYNRLSRLSGVAFDRAYAANQVKDHEHDIALFRQEARDGQNPQIKQFAASTLPVLHQHLTLARQMYRNVENRTNNGGNSATPSGGYNSPGPGTGGANGGTNPNGGATTPR